MLVPPSAESRHSMVLVCYCLKLQWN